MPPNSDHLLAEAYPARMTPNTSLDSTASMKNAATFSSLPTMSVAERQGEERDETGAEGEVRGEPEEEAIGAGRDVCLP